MTSSFREIDVAQINESAFRLIGADWMLITAGSSDSFNMMTASWGGLGVIWGKNVCYCVIRPQRYTYKFMEKSDTFTLTFFDEEYRDALNYCGSNSGRDVNKVAETGLTPVKSDSGSVYFAEARLVLECRKIYYQDINPTNFLDPAIQDCYPANDYHRMYIGEVLRCLAREQ